MDHDIPPPAFILAAEDNATNRQILKILLEKLGYKAHMVENGAQAIAAARAVPFDLILMDLHMPEVDGYNASRAIRNLPGAYGAMPILALTADVRPGVRERVLGAGMDDYMTKPINVTVLAQTIAHRLTQGRLQSALSA